MTDEGTLFSLARSTVGGSGRQTRPLRRSRTVGRRTGAIERTCKRCGVQYMHVKNSGTGTSYCADCKEMGYLETVVRHHPGMRAGPCAICATPCHYRQGKWELCDSCFVTVPPAMVNRLRGHHASVGFVLRVIRSPRCEICGLDVSERRKDHKGRLRATFALDHDHSCCPGGTSCGECLRGLLCQHCNAAIGHLGDSSATIASAVRYLTRARMADAHEPVGSGGEGSPGGPGRSPRCVGRFGWPS
jgi:hypothetical protein